MRAAVLNQVGAALEIRDDVEVEAPRTGEVLVRYRASGVCHTDLSVQTGTLVLNCPMVLGHEGAGVVEEVGDGVDDLRPGDHVVVSWVPQCGRCWFCLRREGHLCENANAALVTGGLLDGSHRFSSRGAPLYQMAASGTFSEMAVVPAVGAVKIPPDVPFPLAALIGCGVLTGVGAAFHTADVQPGASVAVVGCGGVGLNIVQGARMRRAEQIIAVDLQPAKLALAEELGATHLVDAGAGDAVSRVRELTGERGVDVAFEAVGLAATIEATIAMARRGGQSVLVGIPSMDVMVELPAFLGLVLSAKTVTGCWYGSSNTRTDVAHLVELYRSGQLRLEPLVSRTVGLSEVNQALAALAAGEVARTVIEH
ncbi:MAG: Zn-dependent alcohol dehydrogenase [Actinomycetota bacterium]|nr:Zn-dependent alcohol dehydrogenase [Actinomycetota bacterium]